MVAFFNPGIILMNRLKYVRKFALISIMFALPLGFVTMLLMLQLHADIATAQKEQSGAAYLRPLHGLLSHTLTTRMLSNEYLHGEEDVAEQLLRSQLQVDQDFEALHAIDQRLGGELGTTERLNELMIVGPITVRSACSHHLCPIIGKVWIGIMPNEHSNLIGLSKYARLIDWIMSRPQIQEEAVTQVADILQSRMHPDGLAVIMEADHFCMHWRGVKDMDAKMINSVMRGSFLKDPHLRREFLSLVTHKKG